MDHLGQLVNAGGAFRTAPGGLMVAGGVLGGVHASLHFLLVEDGYVEMRLGMLGTEGYMGE